MRKGYEGGRMDEECMVRGEVRKARDESVVRARGEAKGERGGSIRGVVRVSYRVTNATTHVPRV